MDCAQNALLRRREAGPHGVAMSAPVWERHFGNQPYNSIIRDMQCIHQTTMGK